MRFFVTLLYFVIIFAITKIRYSEGKVARLSLRRIQKHQNDPVSSVRAKQLSQQLPGDKKGAKSIENLEKDEIDKREEQDTEDEQHDESEDDEEKTDAESTRIVPGSKGNGGVTMNFYGDNAGNEAQSAAAPESSAEEMGKITGLVSRLEGETDEEVKHNNDMDQMGAAHEEGVAGIGVESIVNELHQEAHKDEVAAKEAEKLLAEEEKQHDMTMQTIKTETENEENKEHQKEHHLRDKVHELERDITQEEELINEDEDEIKANSVETAARIAAVDASEKEKLSEIHQLAELHGHQHPSQTGKGSEDETDSIVPTNPVSAEKTASNISSHNNDSEVKKIKEEVKVTKCTEPSEIDSIESHLESSNTTSTPPEEIELKSSSLNTPKPQELHSIQPVLKNEETFENCHPLSSPQESLDSVIPSPVPCKKLQFPPNETPLLFRQHVLDSNKK